MSISASSAAGLNISSVTTPVAVSDVTANVATYLDSLAALGAAGKLASIVLTDIGTPTIVTTSAQLISDASALLLVANPTWAITLSDTASTAQVLAANTTLAARLTAGFAVSDTAANVVSGLDALENDAGTIGSIALTGDSSVLTLTGAQLITDSPVLLKIGGSHSIVVSGSTTAAQAATMKNPIFRLITSFAVADTAANISSNLDGLKAHVGRIASITLTDSGPITLTAGQFIADQMALLKITGSYSITLSGTATAAQAAAVDPSLAARLTAGFTISDTAANVASSLDALETNGASIASITLTDNPAVLTLTGTQLVADAPALLKIGGSHSIVVSGSVTAAQAATMKNPIFRLITSFAVADTAANISSNLDGLKAHVGRIASITPTDSGPITLTAAQLIADQMALMKIVGSYSITLSGTATVAQVLGADSTLVGSLTAGFAVADTAANISSSLDALQAMAGSVASVALTGTSPVLSMTVGQLLSDSPILLKVTGLYGIALSGTATVAQVLAAAPALLASINPGFAVSDTSGNVVTNLSALQGDAGSIASINLTDNSPVLSLTAAQLIADAAVLLKITSSFGIILSGTATVAQLLGANPTLAAKLTSTVALSDTAANVASNLTALENQVGTIASIALTGGSSILSLTVAQLITDSPVLLKVTGNHGIAPSGTATIAQVLSVNPALLTELTTGFAISDSAANVLGNLDTLQAMGSGVGSIVLTDGGSPVIAVSPSQLIADAGVLGTIASDYTLTVSSGSMTVAQVVALPQSVTAHISGQIAISDTAAAVAGSLDALQARRGALSGITLTGTLHTISLTAATLVADAGVLSLITNSHTLNVLSGTVTAAQALVLGSAISPFLASGLSVSDTTANIASNLDGLQALGGTIASVVLTDSSPPVITLTAAQFVSDAAFLLKISNGIGFQISGTATAAQAVSANSTLVASLQSPYFVVSDTAADIVSNLAGLQTLANGNKLGSITLTNSGTPALSMTAATLIADSGALATITNNYTLSIASGTVTAAQAVSLNSSVTPHITAGLVISDTAANVDNNIGGLQAEVGFIASIALTDTSPVLTLSTTQFAASTPLLLKITGNYAITLSGTVTAAQAVALNSSLAAHLTAGVAVSDNAVDVMSNLDALQALGNTVGSITLTDGGSPTVTVTAATLVADAGALSKITGSYSLVVSSGTVTAAQAEALGPLSTSVAVSDSSTNIANNLDALQGLGTKVSTITLTDVNAAIHLTATQLISDAPTLLKINNGFGLTLSGTVTAAQAAGANPTLVAHLTAGLAVSDIAANVASNLDGLQSIASGLGSITITDGAIAVTPTQFSNDTAALLKITSGNAIHLSGTATAAQVANANTTLIGLLNDQFVVSDSAANVVSNIDGLQAAASLAAIASITLTDASTPTLSVDAATLVEDAAALALIGSPYSLNVTSGSVTVVQALALDNAVSTHLSAGLSIEDSSAQIASHLDGLQALGNAVAGIALTDVNASIPLTASQLIADAPTLLKIANGFGLTLSGTATAAQAAGANAALVADLTAGLAVSDTTANITASLNGLQTLATANKLGPITLTDGGTPALSISAATLLADAGALALISNSYTINVLGTVDVQSALALNPTVAAKINGGLTVLDSPANVSSNLTGLQALGTIGAVTLSGTPATFAVTATQLSLDAGILGTIITGGVALVADSSHASPAAVAANLGSAPPFTGALLFTDTAANVVTFLGALQALAGTNNLGTITLTDGGTPTVSITTTQLLNDGGALARIGGAYALSIVSGTLTAAQAIGLGGPILSHLTAALPVLDSATNIVSNLDALQAIAASIGSVAFTGSPPTLSLTTTKVISDINVLAAATGYNLTVSGSFTAAQAATLDGTSVPTHLTSGAVVSDTSANVSAQLAPLEALATINKLGTVTLTDGAPLTVTPAQLLADLAVFRKITGSYTFALTAPLNAGQAAGISSLLTSRLPANLAVTDSAAAVFTNLDALEVLAVGHHLGSVTLNDGGVPVLEVTADQLTSDADVLAVITAPFKLQIDGGITAAQAVYYASHTSALSGPVNVVDSASAVQGALGSLETLANAHLLNTTTLTDSGTPDLALTAAAFAGGLDALLTIVGGYTVSISSGTLSVAQLQSAATLGVLANLSGTIGVSDTGTDIVSGLGTLLTNLASVGAITVSDSGTPLVVTAGVLSTDSAVLAKIGSYTITVSGMITTAAADAIVTGYNAQLAVAALSIADTAANVDGDLPALQSLGSKIHTVAITDTATAAQAVDIAGGLSGYLSGAITVTDTGADVVAGLAGLLTNIANIGAITISNVGVPLGVTSTQLIADGAVFAKIGAYAVDVTDPVSIAIANTINTGYGSHLASHALTISDTAANVYGDLTTLESIGSSIFTITVTGTATTAQAVEISGGVSSYLSGTIAISDTGANVVAGLGSLLSDLSDIGTITLSDNTTPLLVTSADLTADAAVFAKIGAYSLTVSDTISTATANSIIASYAADLANAALTISDTAANVSADLTALEALGVQLHNVAVTGTASAQQAVAIAAGLGNYLSGTIAVEDTGAHIQTSLGDLLSNVGSVGSITISDASTPLVLTSADLAADGAVLGKIVSYSATVSDTISTATADTIIAGYDANLAAGALTISDTAANVDGDLAALEALGTKLNTVAVTDSASVASAVAIAAGLSTHVSGSIAVEDTGANVLSGLGSLLSNIAQIGTITLSDPGNVLSVTSAQLNTDSAVFARIAGYTVTVSDTVDVATADAIIAGYDANLASGALTVSDTAAQVAGDLVRLGALGNKLISVAVTGPATADQAVAIAAGLGVLAGTMTVTDTGAALISDLASLLSNLSSISAITLSDPGTPLVATSAQLSTDSAVFGKIAAYTVTVSDTLTTAAADTVIAAYSSQLANAALTVSDTAANVNGDISALLALGSKLHTVTVTDPATVAQAVAIGGLSAGQLTGPVAVSDTGADVVAGLAALHTTVIISTITLTDSGTPLVVTSTDLSTYGTVFNEITAYTVTVSDTLTTAAADAIIAGYNTHLAIGALIVSDTAANIYGDLSSLIALGGKLLQVSVTDNATADQAVAIAAGLAVPLATMLNVSDTGAHIVADLDGLHTNLAHINSITVSDSSVPLVVTSAQLSADSGVFALISSFSVTVSDTITVATANSIISGYGSNLASNALTVADTAGNVYGDLTALQNLGAELHTVAVTDTATVAQALAIVAAVSSHLSGTFGVTDTGANIVADTSNLLTDIAFIGAITISNSSTPLVVTSTQLGADMAVFDKIVSYSATVSDTITIATADTITSHYNAHLASGALIIADTAANVSSDLVALEALGSKLANITVTGSATVAQAVAIAAGVGSYLSGPIAIGDTGAQVVAGLPDLLTNVSQIGTITLSDASTPLVVTAAQLAADTTVLAKIASYSATVSDTVTTATADTIDGVYDAHLAVSALTVSDTAAHVDGDLPSLQALGAKLGTVAVTGTATAAQAADIGGSLLSHLTGQIAVTDTAARMTANLDALQTLATANHLGALTLTASSPVFAATGLQVTNDTTAINDIMSATGANPNAVLYVQGTANGDTVDASGLTHASDISLGSNTATMSFVSSAGTISGTPDTVTLGTAGSTVEYSALSGTEVVNGFQFGRDVLNLALNNTNPADLSVTDVTLSGVSALSISFPADDTTHGLFLVNTGVTAANVISDHTFTAGSHILIS